MVKAEAEVSMVKINSCNKKKKKEGGVKQVTTSQKTSLISNVIDATGSTIINQSAG